MTKLIQKQQSITFSIASEPDVEPALRLVVLIPCLEADFSAVTRRVWEIANSTGAHVKFLGLSNDTVQESTLRRNLTSMSAMTNYGRVYAEAEIISGKDWVEAVKSRRQAGDTVVCFAEQRAGLLQKPLSQILQSDLDVPLHILYGFFSKSDSHSTWSTRVTAWIGFVVILFGFVMLQVRIFQLAKEWTGALMLLSIAVEYWLMWLWNNLF